MAIPAAIYGLMLRHRGRLRLSAENARTEPRSGDRSETLPADRTYDAGERAKRQLRRHFRDPERRVQNVWVCPSLHWFAACWRRSWTKGLRRSADACCRGRAIRATTRSRYAFAVVSTCWCCPVPASRSRLGLSAAYRRGTRISLAGIIASGIARNETPGFARRLMARRKPIRSHGAAMLLPGFLAIARDAGLSLNNVKSRPSAGVTRLFNRFARSSSRGKGWGDRASAVRLAPEIRGCTPRLDGAIAIASRTGSDVEADRHRRPC